MKSDQKNYLRTLRLGSGLTQGDVAFLLGMKSRTALSYIESRKAYPPLNVLIACRTIYAATLIDMIPADIEAIESDVVARAAQLLNKLQGRNNMEIFTHRLNVLRRIAETESI